MLGQKVSPQTIRLRAKTKRQNSLGNRRRQHLYWQVMTMQGYRYEHRVVMEDAIGRKLGRKEHVHHKNGNTLDNRLENLELLSASAHAHEHGLKRADHCRQMARLAPGQWSRRFERCVECQTTRSKHAAKGICCACYIKRYNRRK